MTPPFAQALSEFVKLIFGVVLLVIGSVAGYFAALIFVAFLRDLDTMRDVQSFEAAIVVGLLAPCGAVFCTVGYRLLFRSSEAAGSMLPGSLWLALSIFFGAWATFSLGALVFAPPKVPSTVIAVFLSSIVMSAFSVWCCRARPVGKVGREGAASNNRWRGP